MMEPLHDWPRVLEPELARDQRHDRIISALFAEMRYGLEKFGNYNSPREGVGVIEEEFLELRAAVYWPLKGGRFRRWLYRLLGWPVPNPIREALQVAATALRFALEYGEDDD